MRAAQQHEPVRSKLDTSPTTVGYKVSALNLRIIFLLAVHGDEEMEGRVTVKRSFEDVCCVFFYFAPEA
jgi:threonyl-tRNA synthetase